MKKIVYIALSLALCTAGLCTAAHYSPSLSMDQSAINDTIDTTDDEEDFDEIDDEEEEEDEFGDFIADPDLEDGEVAEEDSTDLISSAENDTIPEDLDLPEGMLIDVNQELKDWNAQQYLTIDSTKIAPVDETQTAAEEYTRRLKRIPAIMEMPYNDIVRKYIDQYTGRLRQSVSFMLGAQNFYVPIFEEALEMQDCPLELKYLPIIESALDPTATSRVGAAGLWQFMVATGKQYGLEVNSLVDERRDPIKSSHAAAEYFKKLYSQFGDWTLVIAAYNCGPNNVNKAIQRAGGSKDYWQIYPYLPRETRGYVPAFIAANYIMQFYCEHGIVAMQAKLPLETDTIMVSKDLHFQQVADLCDVDINALKSLNPQYRQQIVPGYWKPCTLRLPAESVNKFLEWGDSIYNYRVAELLPRRSTVAVNDNYTPVVRQGYSSSKSSKASSRSKRSKKNRSSRGGTSVTIRQGDTLGAIAKRNHTTVAKLKKLNGISGTNIRAGKKIRVK